MSNFHQLKNIKTNNKHTKHNTNSHKTNKQINKKMACCIACIACCACKLCADCMAKTVKLCGVDIELRVERFLYAVSFTVVTVLGWALGTYLDYDKLDVAPGFESCRANNWERDNTNVRGCYVNLMVSKVMFGLMMWHFVQAIIFICTRYEEDCRVQIQVGWWFPKVVILGGLVAGAVYIPNDFYIVWNWFTLVGAFFFILVQIYILVSFAHEVAKFFLDLARDRPDEERCNPYVGLLLTASAIMYIASLVMTVLMFLYFTRRDSNNSAYPDVCKKRSLNAFFVAFNLVLSVIASVLSILPAVREKNENAGLLQAAMLTLYTTYIVFSALVTEPEEWTEGCKSPLSDLTSSTSASTVGQRAVAIIGVIITVVAVCYSTFMSARESFAKVFTDMCGCCEGGDGDGAPAGEPVSYNFTLFHVVFILGAMYVQQLLTNWKTISKLPFDDSELASTGFLREITVNSGKTAIWIKIVSSWIVFVLYIWSLIVPVLFPDRDFGY